MSRVSQFFVGFRFVGRGFLFLFRHPSLWPLVILPWILAFLLLALSWGLFIHYYPGFYQFLLSHLGLQVLPEAHGFWGTLGFSLLWGLKQLLKLSLFLLGLVFLSLVTFLVYLILSAPFLDLLAEKVTQLSRGIVSPSFEWRRFFKSIGQTMWVEMLKGLLFIAVPLFLLLLNLIPAVGSFLYSVMTCLFGMWGLGFICFDYPMGHQFFSFGARFKEARRAKYYLMGFGAPFLIPFAPLLLQPPMVIGGTLLYHHLNNERSPSAYS